MKDGAKVGAATWFVGCQQSGNLAVIDRKPAPTGEWDSRDGDARVVAVGIEAIEDARLLASAPELLAELIRAHTILLGMDPHGLYRNGKGGLAIAAAIAKAGGA